MLRPEAKDRALYASIYDLVRGPNAPPKSMLIESDECYNAFLQFIQGLIEASKQEAKATTERQEKVILTFGEQTEREPAPEGPQRAECIEIKDLGLMTEDYGEGPTQRRKVEFRWQLDAKNSRGFPFVLTRKYNAVMSINPKTGRKSDLRRDLDTWRGKPFTDEEIRAGKADTDQFLHKFCILIVEHKLGKQGGTFSAVTAVMPPLGDTVVATAAPATTPLEAALKASLKNPPADTESEPY